jgi:hypothetical protein
MAIYHFSMRVIKRSAGRSSTAAAAYRAALDIADERTGELHRYAGRGGVATHEILAPSRAPEWAQEAESLWNEVERVEKRKDAQLARENVLALPHELSLEQNRELLRAYVQEAYVRRGMAAQVNIHAAGGEGDRRNIHAHVLMTMRGITRNGFKEKKARNWNEKATLHEWRALWADHVNQALERAGHKERVTEKSFEDLGLDQVPTKHLGPNASEMERRGAQSRIGDENRAAKAQTKKIEALKFQKRVIEETIKKEAHRLAEEKAKAAQAEREKREKADREYFEKRRDSLAGAIWAQQEEKQAFARRELLARDPAFWAQVDKEYAQEEQEIRASYNIAALAGRLAEAKSRAHALNTANGRFSGEYERAEQQSSALEESLKNAKWRQDEALQKLNAERDYLRQEREEREAYLRDAMSAKLNAQYEALHERQGIETPSPAHEQDNAPTMDVDDCEQGGKEQSADRSDDMDLSR